MYFKPEPILKKITRILIVLVLAVTSIYSARFVQVHYLFGYWEQELVRLASTTFIGIISFLAYRRTVSGLKVKEYHLRGVELTPIEKIYKKTVKLVKGLPTIFWGFIPIPASEGPNHFAVVGATGSGKTMLLRMLMQSVLPEIGYGQNKRALIYDAKTDMLPILKTICPNTKIVIFNPFDTRSSAWDMAKDVTSPATCQQLAAALIKDFERQSSQPYFRDTARHFLTGLLTVFNKRAKGVWTFRDLMVAKNCPFYVQAILESEPETRHQLEHFGREETVKDVFSTFQTRMAQYEFVAAVWEHAEERVSLIDWLNEEYIILLGNNTIAAEATNEINRVIFRRMAELLLSQEETSERQTWVFLDEVRQAGELDALNLLLTTGRSKGACCVLGFQDIEGMREVYGREAANELVGQCNNKAVLKLNSPETAEWASKLFGDKEVIEQRRSNNQSQKSFWEGSTNTSDSRVRRQVVTPGELMALPKTHKNVGMHGYYIIPRLGAYFLEADGDLVQRNLAPISKTFKTFDARPDEQQTLKPWDEEDLKRLSLNDVVDLEDLGLDAEDRRRADEQHSVQVSNLTFSSSISR